MVPPSEKAIVFQVDPSTRTLDCQVGREHQADFFSRLVPRKDLLACISRSHFELRLEDGSIFPTLRKLSRNPMHVNNLPIGSEPTQLADKSLVGLKGIFDAEPCFLIFCLTLRSSSALDFEGPHPSLTPRARRAYMPLSVPVAA